ncbi:hypothetical protein [Pseudomonas sp. S1_E04]
MAPNNAPRLNLLGTREPTTGGHQSHGYPLALEHFSQWLKGCAL